MRKFIDSRDREWSVLVTVQGIVDVRDATTIDLGKLFDNSLKLLGELLDDPPRLVDCLWVLCADSGTAAGVTPADFGRSLYGDVLEAATNALIDSTIDFFPNARRRGLVRQVMDKSRAGFTALADRGEAELQKLDPRTLCDYALNSRGSPVSTPDP